MEKPLIDTTPQAPLLEEYPLFKSGPVVVFKWRNAPGWPVEYASTNVKEVFGYTAEELVQGRLLYAQIIHKDDLDRVAEEIHRNWKTGAESFRHKPYRIIRKDGQTAWILDYTLILRNDDGEISHYLGYAVDISKQKQIEQNLKATKEDLQILIDSVNVIPWRFDLKKNRFTFIGKQVEKILGYRADSWTDLESWACRIHSEDRSFAMNFCKTSTEKGEDHDFEYRCVRPDGKTVWLRDIVTVRCDSQGRPAELVGYMIDITKQKQHEEQLEANLRQTELVHQTIVRLNRAQTLQEVYQIAVDGIQAIVQAHRSAILLLGEGGKQSFVAWKNLSEKCRRTVEEHFPLEKLSRDALSNGIFEIPTAKLEPASKAANLQEGIAKLAFIPLAGPSSLLGALIVCFDTPQELGKQEGYLAQVLAQNLAAVITRMQALDRSRQAGQLYRSIFENVNEGIYRSTPKGRFITVNPAMVKMFGFKNEAEMLALTNTAQLYWDDKERQRLVKLANGTEVLTNVEVKMKRADGSPLWVLMNDRAVKDAISGKTLYYEGTLLDITERKQTELFQAEWNRVLESIAADQKLPNVLEDLTLTIEKFLPGMKASILLLDPATQCLRTGAAPSLPAAYNSAIDGVRIGPKVGSCGTAAYKKELIIVEDVQTDPLWENYRELAAKYKLRACWSLPIIDREEGEVLGTFALYYEQPRQPGEKELKLIHTAGYIAGIAIKRIREKEKLLASEAKYRSLFYNVPVGLYQSTPAGRFITVNPAMVKMFGFESEAEMLALTNTAQLYWDEKERQRLVKLANATEILTNIEVKMKRADGSPLWVLMNDRAVKDATSGKTLYYEGTLLDITDRKQAEQALQMSEAKFRAIAQTASDAIVSADSSGSIIVWNRGAEEIFGYNEQEILGQPLNLLIPERFQEMHTEDFTNVSSGRDSNLLSKTMELTGVRKDGREFPIELSKAKWDIGGECYFSAVIRDITERKKAEQALHQQLTFSQALNQVAQNIILENDWRRSFGTLVRIAGEVLDLDRCLIYRVDQQKRKVHLMGQWINPQANKNSPPVTTHSLDQFKESFKQLTASNSWLESHADDVNPFLKAEGSDKLFHEQMQIKSLLWYSFSFDDKGCYLLAFNKVRSYHRWQRAEIAFIESLTNLVSMAIMKSRLMTAMERANAELRRLAAVVEQASESILVTDTEGRIQYVNPAFEKITGYAAEEVIGQNQQILKFGIQDESYYNEMWEALWSGRTWSGRYVSKRKDGTEYTEEGVFFPVKNNQGEIIQFCKIGRDTTREQNLEAQLRRAQKLETIGTLAGGIAHDFNNILTPILGYADMALFMLKRSDPLYSNLEQVLKAAQRAKDLVEQLLLFAKQNEKDRKPLELQPLVKEALKLLRPSIPTTIEIRQGIDASCGKVLADATQIHQVIVNLCTNAWQSMEESGGVLTIELEQVHIDAKSASLYHNLRAGDYARLTISDTGCGMDKTTLERIFEPFFTTKAVDKGTGLGLSVVHGIVRSHKGDILVHSQPNQGSAFHIYLPIYDGEALNEVPKAEEITGGQESILVVDDDKVVAEVLEQILKSLGYKTEICTNAIEAVKALHFNPKKYDLLISDLTMPNMTGLELAEQIQKVSPGFPIILVTGYGENLDKGSLQSRGIKRVLGKPVEVKELDRAIRKVLNNTSK
ncbi:MAG: PAS domain S-box protein [Bacteroidetes bacterium]|nr:MAG: PAS domain S-box protein [Bacteroidota bacterium]